CCGCFVMVSIWCCWQEWPPDPWWPSHRVHEPETVRQLRFPTVRGR
ncbi:MAG: hypothetical protein AVDCRST_MAG76-3819, partial [uncultured Acidimicrobiales bacterium]